MNSIEPVPNAPTCFVTVLSSIQEEPRLRLMIESLRAFGGSLLGSPVWVFLPPGVNLDSLPGLNHVALLPLEIDEPLYRYELADKVFACAQAETLAGTEVRALVWVNLDCLIVNPPLLLALSPDFDLAMRPVHIRNVGSLARDPLDEYWKGVYQTLGIQDLIPYTVESFVDSQVLRPYFNTHCFAINPGLGLLQSWRDYFKMLVLDRAFQAGPCQDELHQVFLHQVVLSALIMKSVEPERICHLPPEYSYPLHLQRRLSADQCTARLNDLVCAVFEEVENLSSITVEDPLAAWLAAREISW